MNRVRHGHDERRFQTAHVLERADVAGELLEQCLIIIFASLLRFGSGHRVRNHFFKRGERHRPLRHAFGLDGVLQLRINREPLMKLGHGALKRSAILCGDFLHALVFAIENLVVGDDLVPGKMFAIGLFTFLGQLEQRDEVGIVHAERGPRIGHGGIHHHIRQPLGSGKDARMIEMRFPRFGVDGLFFADLEQGVARDRVEWLHAAVEDYRQAAEVIEVETGLFRRVQLAEEPQCHDEHEQRRRPFLEDLFHG